MRYSRRWMSTVIATASAGALVLTGCSKKDENTSGASTASSGAVKVAFVPKVQGIPYFEAMNTGGKAAAKKLGIQWIYQGATTGDAAAQADIVKSLIQQKVDVIAVAPNDPDSLAPVLKLAKQAGIKVMTTDTDAPNSARQVFVNQATAEGIGRALTDQIAKATGGEGEYAIVSCGQTAANLNSWIAEQKSYTASKYPKLKIADIVYAGEDQAQAVTMAKSLMSAHPNLKGLVGECTTSAPGVAQAVKEAGKIGKVFTVGVGTPTSMKPFLNDGSSSASVLWDVQNLGYLTAWAGAQLAADKSFQVSNKVNASMPAVTYTADQKMLLLGEPLIITKANAGEFDY
ncbi:autoinducer 2 ABC transporter substrate-binding protein [Streptomyces canus]|uniref:autoinducer 2 ABC transporter substrate-binding protein n=1 Tax=Streptomyces canus TaxID=58343 RepID=UPI0027893198|nr:autoinducer 2 ABC transporter substrate-binding protein [Streptomyces canus]MDQ0765527.1 rhamnose transport system substrate-binding protein [Streptomyces canus]